MSDSNKTTHYLHHIIARERKRIFTSNCAMLHSVIVVLMDYLWPVTTAIYSKNEGVLKVGKKFNFQVGRSEIQAGHLNLF